MDNSLFGDKYSAVVMGEIGDDLVQSHAKNC